MADEKQERRTLPSFKLKELGAKTVLTGIERFGATFYEKLAEALGLNQADLEVIQKEVDRYLDMALFRCPHLVEASSMEDIEQALAEATFEVWSDSSKRVRAKKD